MKLSNLRNDTTDIKRRVANVKLSLTLSLPVNISAFLLGHCLKQPPISMSTYNSDYSVSYLTNLKEPEANSNSVSEVGHFLMHGCTLQHYFIRHCLLKESHGLKRVAQESCFENENVHGVINV